MEYEDREEHGVMFYWKEEDRFWRTESEGLRVCVYPPERGNNLWLVSAPKLRIVVPFVPLIPTEELVEKTEEMAFRYAAALILHQNKLIVH